MLTTRQTVTEWEEEKKSWLISLKQFLFSFMKCIHLLKDSMTCVLSHVLFYMIYSFMYFIRIVLQELNWTPWDNRNGWLGVKHQITYLLCKNCVSLLERRREILDSCGQLLIYIYFMCLYFLCCCTYDLSPVFLFLLNFVLNTLFYWR